MTMSETTSAAPNSFASRRAMAVPRGVRSIHDIVIDRAKNAEVFDSDGKRYIDFVGGIGVLNVGHCHDAVIAAAESQLRRFTHSCFNAIPHDLYVSVAEELKARAPIGGDVRVMLTNSGAEAVENAIKVSRAATGRQAMVAFRNGFHGRTLASLALNGKSKPHKTGLGVLPGPVFHVGYPSPDSGVTAEETWNELQALFANTIEPDNVAAFVFEPVQGEGGFAAIDPDFLKALRAFSDRHGILLVADEIQSGMGRTGDFFAIEHSGVEPDLLVLGKSIAGGLPLAALIGRAEMMDRIDPGGLGSTFGGNAVACAAALAVFDIYRNQDLLTRSRIVGDAIAAGLEALRGTAAGAHLGRIRGRGGMRAVEILSDGKPDGAKLKSLIDATRAAGLLILSSGEKANIIRFLPPLTIEDNILDEGLGLLAGELSRL